MAGCRPAGERACIDLTRQALRQSLRVSTSTSHHVGLPAEHVPLCGAQWRLSSPPAVGGSTCLQQACLRLLPASADITSDCFRQEDYKLILGVIARRLHSEPNCWRRIYKSLLLLEYMAKNGPDRMVTELQSNQKVFTRLQTFEYIDSHGKDQGINVRNRC